MPRQKRKRKGAEDEDIRAFSQHGFVEAGRTGDQAYGKCPFCGHKKHKHPYTFYLNVKTHQWDCKSCLKEGGFKTFLSEIVITSKERLDEDQDRALLLSSDRSISLETVEKMRMGYNIASSRYILPAYDVNNDALWNVYYWKDKVGIRGTATCQPALLGWDRLNNLRGRLATVLICEGHWDYYVATEFLPPDVVPVGITGAKQFSAEWAPWFEGKNIICALHNDEAGQQGSARIYNLLKRKSEGLTFVHWGPDAPTKYDVRDMYKRRGSKTWHILQSLTKDYPVGTLNIQVSQEDMFDGPGMLPDDVYKSFQKWLLYPGGKGRDILDVMFATAISIRLPNNPVWMLLVGPSSGGKTVVLESTHNGQGIETASKITAPALISGSTGIGGSDPSLIPQWDQNCVVIKDLTNILKMHEQERAEIWSIWRDAYDGYTQKSVGTGQWRGYKCHFSMIAGTTRAVDLDNQTNASLGERFIRWDLPEYTMRERREISNKALDIAERKETEIMKAELMKTSHTVLNYQFDTNVNLPRHYRDRIAAMADFVAMLRSFVPRHRYIQDEVTHQPMLEMPFRVTNEMITLAFGLEMFHRSNEVTERSMKILSHVAKSTAPPRYEAIVRNMWQSGSERTYTVRDHVSDMTGLGVSVSKRMIEDLRMIKVVRSVHVGAKLSATTGYILTDNMKEVIEDSGIYQLLTRTKTKGGKR